MTATADSAARARRALIGSGLTLALAVGLANGLNAAFQIVLARILSRSEYSLLAVLVAIVLVGAVPPLAFQATTARHVARSLADGRPDLAGVFLRGTIRASLQWTAVILVLTAIVFPVAGAAGLAHPLALGATSATVAVALPIPVLWGGLQGAGRFRDLSWATLLFAGSRFAAAVVIAEVGGGVGAIMIGVAVATALTAVASILPLRGLVSAARGSVRERLATLPNAAAAVGLTALMALAMTDLVVAKLSFSSGRAGDYAAASVGARALLLIPIAVTTVLFPRVATLGDAARERRHLLAGLGAVAGTAAVATALLWTLAKPLIDITFGAKYDHAAPWLGPLSLAMALYALATVYLYHFLSLGRFRFSAVVAGLLAVQILAFGFLHSSPNELIGVQITISAVTLAACEVWHLRLPTMR